MLGGKLGEDAGNFGVLDFVPIGCAVPAFGRDRLVVRESRGKDTACPHGGGLSLWTVGAVCKE